MAFEELAAEFLDSMLNAKHVPAEKGEHTVPKGEFGVLVFLTHHKNGASVGELTEFLRVTSGRTATTLNSLQRKGLIQRHTDETDNRRILVYITEKGREQFEEEQGRALAVMSEFFGRLGEDDAREYIRLMRKAHPDM